MIPTPGEYQQPNEQPLYETDSTRVSNPIDEARIFTAQEATPTAIVPPAPAAPGQNPLIRLLTRPATWRWGLVIVGLLLAIVGSSLIYAASSYSPQQSLATYKTIRGTVQGFVFTIKFVPDLSKSVATDYVALDETGTFYYFNESDLTPAFDSKSITTGMNLAVIYRPDQSIDMNQVLAPFNERVIGTGIAYKAVQVSVFDTNGQNPRVFTTAEYTRYTQASSGAGVTTGIAVLIVGLVIAALAFGVPLIRGRLGKNKQSVPLEVAPTVAVEVPVVVETPMLPGLDEQYKPPQSD